MALRIIDGKPGSGKSYYLVRLLAKQYCTLVDGAYSVKDGITIIANIDGLKLPHIDLAEQIKSAGSADHFFSLEHQKKLTEEIDGNIVYCIDEAQKFWRSGDKTKTQNLAFEYFELHRHLGHDVYLCTQNYQKLPKQITVLPEFIIRSAPRSRSLMGEFRYWHVSEGETVKTESIRRDQAIFALYKSMDREESVKVKNPLMPKVFAMSALAAALIFGGAYWIKHSFSGNRSAEAPQTSAAGPAKPASAPADPAQQGFVEVIVSTATIFKNIRGVVYPYTMYVIADRWYDPQSCAFPLRKTPLVLYATIPRSLLPAEQAPERSPSAPSEGSGPAVVSADTPPVNTSSVLPCSQ